MGALLWEDLPSDLESSALETQAAPRLLRPQGVAELGGLGAAGFYTESR